MCLPSHASYNLPVDHVPTLAIVYTGTSCTDALLKYMYSIRVIIPINYVIHRRIGTIGLPRNQTVYSGLATSSIHILLASLQAVRQKIPPFAKIPARGASKTGYVTEKYNLALSMRMWRSEEAPRTLAETRNGRFWKGVVIKMVLIVLCVVCVF